MLKKIEKFINIGIGITILNNLYYFSGIFGLSSSIIIIACLLISLLFFLLNFNKDQIVNLINSWNTVFYILASIPLCFIDWIINGSTPVTNDIIRVILYFLFFSWSFSINNKTDLNKWFIRISLFSIIILTIQGLFENANPLLFSLILSGNIEKRILTRIAGTLIDSNSYACAICSYSFILFYEYIPKKQIIRNIVLFTIFCVCFYLTDIAGSRQGLLMLIIFFFLTFFVNISIKRIKVIGFFLLGTFFIVLIMFNNITNYIDENPSSSFARLFFTSQNERSLQSNLDRTHSIEDGIKLIGDNYFIYGPGALNFASRWASSSDAHEPHNGFLFLLVQFGIWGLIPIFVLFISGKRAYIAGTFIFYLTFLIHFSLQPNEIYYGNMFLCLFYIDTKYYFLKSKEIYSNN